MLAFQQLRRALANGCTVALILAMTHAPPVIAASQVSISGVVDDTDAIASCSLTIGTDGVTVTPIVTLQPPPRKTTTSVRFTFFDAANMQVGMTDVAVPPPSFGPLLSSFAAPAPFTIAHCTLTPPPGSTPSPTPAGSDAPADSPSPSTSHGGGGSGTVFILLGVLAVGGIAAAAGGSHGGGGGSTPAPSTPFPSTPTPVPSPTPKHTATPVVTPSPSPTASPTATPTASPTASPTATPTSTPTASPTPTPAPIVLTPASLQFTATGSAYAQTSTASESMYSGTFTAGAGTCGGIATISASGSSFTITPQSAGTCSFPISDSNNQTAQLSVTVTTSSGVIEGRRHSPPPPRPH